jgi:hypothetical protein
MLKYLFEAHFKDDTLIQQSPDDISKIDPTKSAFYDVLQREDDLIAFGLYSNETSYTYAVDLRDSHFEINKVPFFASDALNLPRETKFRLIYFRQVRRHFHVGTLEPQGIDTSFHIGWQTTVDGKNYQHIIATA